MFTIWPTKTGSGDTSYRAGAGTRKGGLDDLDGALQHTRPSSIDDKHGGFLPGLPRRRWTISCQGRCWGRKEFLLQKNGAVGVAGRGGRPALTTLTAGRPAPGGTITFDDHIYGQLAVSFALLDDRIRRQMHAQWTIQMPHQNEETFSNFLAVSR